MEELYEYNGKQYTLSQLQEKYGDKAQEAIGKFGFKKIEQQKPVEETFSFKGKTFTRKQLEEKYGDKTDVAIEKFGFESNLKKNESSKPTSQNTKLDSEPKIGSLVTPRLSDEEKSQFDKAFESQKQDSQKDIFRQPDIATEYKDIDGTIKKYSPQPEVNKNLEVANRAYDFATSNASMRLTIQRLNDEVNDNQVLDYLREGSKQILGGAVDMIATGVSYLDPFGGKKWREQKKEGNLELISTKPYVPLERETEIAKEEYKQQGIEATPKMLRKRAEELFIEQDQQEQMAQLIDKALPSGYDREGVWKELKLNQLRSNDKLRSKVASAEVYKSIVEEYKVLENTLKEDVEKGVELSEDTISQYNALLEKAVDAEKKLNNLAQNFEGILKEARNDEEKLELFKYNYNDYEKNASLIWNTTKNIVAGTTKIGAETIDYASQRAFMTKAPGMDALSEMASQEMIDNEAENAQFYRYKASNINSWSDLGSFASQLFSEQAPILASIYLGGNYGLTGISLGSGGQKINELQEQAKLPFGKQYTKEQELMAGFLYAGAEGIPEKFGTARIIKDLQRTIRSASSTSRRLFLDGFNKATFTSLLKATPKALGRLATTSGLEGGTELITAESQIKIDKELLGIIKTDTENMDMKLESFISGAFMGGSMSIAGGALGFVVAQSKLYSESKDVAKAKEIFDKIRENTNEIETNTSLTEAEVNQLYRENNELSNKAFSIVEKNANKGVNLSLEQKSFLLDINVRQAELRKEGKEVLNSNFSKEIKDAKINELKAEFNSLEKKRNTTLEGGYNKLLQLNDEEALQLKEKAIKTLIEEAKLAGKTDFKFDDKTITNKAIEIYEKQQQETKQEAQPQTQEQEEVNQELTDLEQLEDVFSNIEEDTTENTIEEDPFNFIPEEVAGTPISNLIGKRVQYTDPITNEVKQGDSYMIGQTLVVEDNEGNITDIGNISELSKLEKGKTPITEIKPTFVINENNEIVYNGQSEKIEKGTPITPQGAGLKSIRKDKKGNITRVIVSNNKGETINLTGQEAIDLAYTLIMDIHSKGGLINKIESNEEIKQEIENEYDRQVQQATESKAVENTDEAIQRGDTGRQGTVETPEIANDSDIDAEKPTVEKVVENKPKEDVQEIEAKKTEKATPKKPTQKKKPTAKELKQEKEEQERLRLKQQKEEQERVKLEQEKKLAEQLQKRNAHPLDKVDKTIVIGIKSPKGITINYEVSLAKDGSVISVVNEKTKKPIERFVIREIKNKKTNAIKKAIVKNILFVQIENKALNDDTFERKFKDAINNIQPTSYFEFALISIAKGQKFDKEDVKKESNKDNAWVYGKDPNKKYPTIVGVSENLLEETSKVGLEDDYEIRNALLEVIGSFSRIDDLKQYIIDNYNAKALQEKFDKENHYEMMNRMSEQEFAMYELMQAEAQFLDEMTDEEKIEYFIELQKNYDLAKQEVDKQIAEENKDVELEEYFNLINQEYEQAKLTEEERIRQEYRSDQEREISDDSNNQLQKQNESIKSIELKEAEENIEKALARLQSAREALKNKGKALDKEIIKDQEDIFGQRKSDNENLLFNERVDADARNKATENERNEVKKASEALEKARQAREDILAGKKPLTQNIFDQAIENLDKLDKDLRDFGRQTLGINIPIVVARGAIQAMKVAMKTTKVGAEVLKAGIDYIKTTEWFQKLSDAKKEKITTENLKSFLVKSVKINQEQEDKIDALLQKIQDKKLNSKQAHDEIVQFIKYNKIKGLIRTRQMNALIRKALDILTARDVYKAVQNFKDYYIQVKSKAEEVPLTDAQKKELRQNRIQNDVEFFFQQGMTLDEILQQTNDNGVLIFSSKEDIKYATTIFHNLNAKNISDKEHYENYIRKVEEGKQAILDAQKKKFKFREFWNKTIVGLFKSDRNADMALEALGKAEKFASSQLSKQQERLIAMRGMSAKAEQILKEIELSVYGDDIPLSKKTIEFFKKNGKKFAEAMKNNSLTSFEKAKLDIVIQLKTFISIDKHRRENGITEEITHPAYTGENQAEGALRHLREKLGDKLMDELEKRADIYFDGMRKILDMLEDSGMIDKDTREFFFTRNYQPRKFVHHMLESADENIDVQSTTFGINSKDPVIESLVGGSEKSLVVDSQFLLSMAIISVTKQTAQNKLNKSIFDRLLTLEDEYKQAKQMAEAQRTKQQKDVIKTYETLKDKILLNPIVRVLENGTEIRQYSNETMPKNMKRVYFRTKGIINEFLMDKSLFDEMMGNNIINKLGEPYVFDPLLDVSGTFVEFAKMLNTGRNPLFFIKNVPRDFVATLLLSPEYSNFKPLATLQLSKDLINVGVNVSKGTITNEGINLLRLYIENGGGMNFYSTQGQLIRSAGTVYANEITRFEKVFNTFFKNKRAKENLVSLFDVVSLHEINKMSEVIFRLANFSRAIKNRLNDLGVDSLDQLDAQTKEDVLISAVASSRRILDFGQKGTASRLIEKGIAYKGVASQAAYSTGEQIRIRPIQMASALLQIASLPAIAVGMYNLLSIWADGEDDEPMDKTWERYMKWRKYQISYNKKGYFHFYTGKTNKDGIPITVTVAKTHEMIGYTSFAETVIENTFSEYYGKKQYIVPLDEAFNELQKSLREHNTPYDPFSFRNLREIQVGKPISIYGFGFDPHTNEYIQGTKEYASKTEGLSNPKVDDFYKEIGLSLDLSPLRLKYTVEAMTTRPETNPMMGFAYGGLDAMLVERPTIKKRLDKISENVGKIIFREGSEYALSEKENERIDKEVKRITETTEIYEAELKNTLRDIENNEISKEKAIKKIKSMFAKEPKRVEYSINRIKNMNRDKGISREALRIKYMGFDSKNSDDLAQMRGYALYEYAGGQLNRDNERHVQLLKDLVKTEMSEKEFTMMLYYYQQKLNPTE